MLRTGTLSLEGAIFGHHGAGGLNLSLGDDHPGEWAKPYALRCASGWSRRERRAARSDPHPPSSAVSARPWFGWRRAEAVDARRV